MGVGVIFKGAGVIAGRDVEEQAENRGTVPLSQPYQSLSVCRALRRSHGRGLGSDLVNTPAVVGHADVGTCL